MNPKYLNVRMDSATGDLWLTEERYRKPGKKLANITSPILLAFAAEFAAEDHTQSFSRDVRFNDGTALRITVEQVKEKPDADL